MKARASLLVLTLAVALGAHGASAGTADAAAPAASAASQRIAVVNGTVVTVEEYERAYAVAVRNRFYHRAPPEGSADDVRRDVADGLVDRALLLAEARKRRLKVDEDAIREVLEGYEARYGASPNWAETRARALPQIARELRDKQLLESLEGRVRDVPAPSEADARAYYASHPELFTEPERTRVAVILLKVDPAAPRAVRQDTREEAARIHARLADGEDFAELARQRSGDPSAANGGDLGYLHRGMLGEALHQAIDPLAPGEVAQPVDVLEGVAIFKLRERTPAKLRDFASVRERAGELLKRERADAAWKRLVAELRRDAVIDFDEALYPKPHAAAAGGGGNEATWAMPQPPRGP